MLAVIRVLLRALELLAAPAVPHPARRARPHCLQPPAWAAALCRQRGHGLHPFRADPRLCGGAAARPSSATTRWARSCTTTPSAGSPPPSTTRAATSSAPSIRASIACATSTTPAEAIDVGDYTANPDHKSIPVREVPEQYWQCLVYQEDRNLGGPLNPFGIDLAGVLKIPLSTLRRSILARHPGARHRRLHARHAVRARHLPDAAARGRRRAHQAQAQVRRMVARARHLPRADPRRRHQAEAMGRRSPVARAAYGRLAAARHRGDEPHRLRQGGEGPHSRRAVRARLRRQPPDHPPAGQRAAERGAARPLALPHGSARPLVRAEAHHG